MEGSGIKSNVSTGGGCHNGDERLLPFLGSLYLFLAKRQRLQSKTTFGKCQFAFDKVFVF